MVDMKAIKKYKLLILAAAVVVLSVAIDLVTKVIAQNNLQGNTVSVIGDWLQLTYTTNGGSSFSFLDGHEGANIIFFVITLIGLPLIGALIYFNRKGSLFGNVGLMLMLGGTLGNAIDRAFLGDGFFNGRVRDFISVKGFAVFNFADMCLVVGVIMFIIALLFLENDALFGKKENKKDE